MVTKRNRLFRLYRDRKSAVALMAPVLIACGALAVDATSWFGTREALQTAADAAALSASMSGLTGSAADSVAVDAANASTGSVFDFTTASGGTGNVAMAMASAGTGAVSYTAQVSAPLNSYLLRFVPQFFGGGPASTQAAALRKAEQVTIGGGGCILAMSSTAAQAINVSGAGIIKATNCGIFANSSANSAAAPSTGDAITATQSGRIEGMSVGTVGGIYAAPYSAYVGVNDSTDYGVGSGAYGGGAALPDPLAKMGDPPAFPAMPAQPSPSPSVDMTVRSNVPRYTAFTDSWGGCDASANCYFEPGTYNGSFQTDTVTMTLYTGANSTNSNDASTYSFFGQFALSGPNNQVTFEKGTYYVSGDESCKESTDNNAYSICTNIDNFNIDGGTYYVYGGMALGGTGGPVTFGQGDYFLEGSGGGEANGGGAALDANVTQLTFTGGTYFFNGGLNLTSYGMITFGPGIYYVTNGDPQFGGSANIIVNGATFVLEGNAAFILNGGTKALNMQAPTTNCVQPADYPVAADVASFPYDGTDGQGICGVLIYQARSDHAASSITAGAQSTLNGIVYAPGTALTVSGGTTFSAGTTPDGSPGTMGLIASTITDAGSSTIIASAASGSPVGTTTKTVYVSSLTQ